MFLCQVLIQILLFDRCFMLRICYSMQVSHNYQNVQVMTFGQPRIGNAVFASYYSNIVPNTFRVTNGNDIVPHLPPFYSYFPRKTYRHFPREVCFIDTLNYTKLLRTCDGVHLMGKIVHNLLFQQFLSFANTTMLISLLLEDISKYPSNSTSYLYR